MRVWGHCGAWAQCVCVRVYIIEPRSGWAGGDREDHPAPTPQPWAGTPCTRAGYSGTPGPSPSTVMGGDTRCVLVCSGERVCVSAHTQGCSFVCPYAHGCVCVLCLAAHPINVCAQCEDMALLTSSRIFSAFPA